MAMKQLRFRLVERSKSTLSHILFLTVVVLAFLPFWTSFQDLLTRLVMSVGWYRSIQNVIVPYELRVVGSILTLVNLPVRVGIAYIEWTKANGQNEVIYLIWNCVGWQTLVLFLLTLLTGLSGRHTWTSKFEALSFGILGTYLINIGRLVAVILAYMFIGKTFGQVFHDYFSNILTITWLFFYWWFSFKYVLEEKYGGAPPRVTHSWY